MIEKDTDFAKQFIDFFVKIMIPSFIAISIKIATQIKREKMTFVRIFMSYVVGIGCGYFIYPFVKTTLQTPFIPIIVALVSISGEKIAEFFIYKWNIDYFLSSIMNAFKEFLIKIINPK